MKLDAEMKHIKTKEINKLFPPQFNNILNNTQLK